VSAGRTLPALRIFGRIADQLVTAAGTTSPYLVEEALLTGNPGCGALVLHCAARPAASRSLRNGRADEAEERDRCCKEIHELVARMSGRSSLPSNGRR